MQGLYRRILIEYDTESRVARVFARAVTLALGKIGEWSARYATLTQLFHERP